MKKLAISMAFAAAVIGLAPTAAADPNTPQAAIDGFLQGLAGAFGSSSNKPPSRPESRIYPDFQSCNREATRLRQYGTAECNPVGGASGQYQLIYIPRR